MTLLADIDFGAGLLFILELRKPADLKSDLG
jgi:hypothetical protein